jgi:hypothetical protein
MCHLQRIRYNTGAISYRQACDTPESATTIWYTSCLGLIWETVFVRASNCVCYFT